MVMLQLCIFVCICMHASVCVCVGKVQFVLDICCVVQYLSFLLFSPCLTVVLAVTICTCSDPSTYGMSRVQRSVCGNPTMRMQNLQLAVNCLKHFYLTTQQQLILVPLPDVTLIAHEPDGGEFV